MPAKTIRVIRSSTGDRLAGRGVTLGYYGCSNWLFVVEM